MFCLVSGLILFPFFLVRFVLRLVFGLVFGLMFLPFGLLFGVFGLLIGLFAMTVGLLFPLAPAVVLLLLVWLAMRRSRAASATQG